MARPTIMVVVAMILVVLTACSGPSESALSAGLNYLTAARDNDWDRMKEYLPKEYDDPDYDPEHVYGFMFGVGVAPRDDLLDEKNWAVETFRGQTRLRYQPFPSIVIWMTGQHGRWLVDPGFDALMQLEWLSDSEPGEMKPYSGPLERTTDDSGIPLTDALQMVRVHLAAVQRVGETEAYVRWLFDLCEAGEVPVGNFSWTVGDKPVTAELVRTNAILDGEVLKSPSTGSEDAGSGFTMTFHLKDIPAGGTDAAFTVSGLKVSDVDITRTKEFELTNMPPIE